MEPNEKENHRRINIHLIAHSGKIPFTIVDDNLVVIVYELIKDGNTLKIMCEAKIDGKLLDLDLPFYYVNPPTGIKSDDGSVKIDPQQAARDMILDTVRVFI